MVVQKEKKHVAFVVASVYTVLLGEDRLHNMFCADAMLLLKSISIQALSL